MRRITTLALAAWMGLIPAAAAPKTKIKPPSTAQLQAQVKKLTAERDDLKDQVAATEGLKQELASAQKGRELAQQEAGSLKKELADIKASMAENQSGSDAILKDLQKAKADLAASNEEKAGLARSLDEANAKLKSQAESVATSGQPDILPARALNLNRVTPKVKNVSRGVVVVNVLIQENGEVLDTRLIQGLPGEGIDVQKANEACLEAARRIVFDPARSADGKTKLRVWQAVGFMVD